MLDIKQRMVDLLNELGDAPAEKLKELGIKGDKSAEDSCPISNYISNSIEHCAVETDNHSLNVFINNSWLATDLPVSVCCFVIDFDNGKYPELIQ